MQLPRLKRKRTSLWCPPSNLASCSVFLLGLSGFWKTTELQGRTAGLITDLRDAIRLTVNQLPDAYSNKFCRALVSNHNDLRCGTVSDSRDLKVSTLKSKSLGSHLWCYDG